MARVLLIDDENELVEMCEIVLESVGHSVVSHQTQHEALALCRSSSYRPDVVVLDLVMPGMSGAQLLERLRGQPESINIPVIIMSALPDAQDRAEELAADGFLAKPFGPDALTAAVDDVLRPKHDRAPP